MELKLADRQIVDGSCRVTFSPRFINENPELRNEDLRSQAGEALLYSHWTIPTPGSKPLLWSAARGMHEGMPTKVYLTSIVGGPSKETELQHKWGEIYAKPADDLTYLKRDFNYHEVAFARAINAPMAIAMIENGDTGILVTKLVGNAVPLSGLRLDFKFQDRRVNNPNNFLEMVVGEIAHANEEGFVHNDLKGLNNTAIQLTPEGPRVIFFDFESANVLQGSDLIAKKTDSYSSHQQISLIEEFEYEARVDLGYFAASLKFRGGFPYRKRKLIETIASIYEKGRSDTRGVLRGKRLYASLTAIYEEKLRFLKDSTKKLRSTQS